MKEIAAERIRNALEDIIRDKKTLVKILSVLLILLLAVILRIHSAGRANITIEASEAPVSSEEQEAPDGDGADTAFAAAAASSASSSAEDASAPSASASVFADIGGAVKSPGVYQISEGTRLFELIEMAGGLTDKADTNSVNQAAFVSDGEKIIIPEKGSSGDPGGGAADAPSPAASASGLININIASKEELTTLNGIGEVMAGRIIEYRQSGRFKSKEDIKKVKGIGDGIYAKIKDSITV